MSFVNKPVIRRISISLSNGIVNKSFLSCLLDNMKMIQQRQAASGTVFELAETNAWIVRSSQSFSFPRPSNNSLPADPGKFEVSMLITVLAASTNDKSFILLYFFYKYYSTHFFTSKVIKENFLFYIFIIYEKNDR
jgi:hypothetical protein